nr:helix-turn-helix transcriptional regulator [uncultured Blautia sp.]
MIQDVEIDKCIDSILEKVNKEIREQNITMATLAEKSGINVSTLSKIMKKRTKLGLNHLFAICKALKIDPNKMLEIPEEHKKSFATDVGLFQDIIFKNNATLIREPKNVAFNGYVGQTYYIYFYSTISSETSLINGILKFDASEENTYCKASLELHTGKKNQEGKDICKFYEGELLISLSMGCCYCILMNSVTGEFCFLNFRHMYLFHQPLVCRVAAALTTSSGESKLPTVHRALISNRKLHFTDDNDSDLDFIQGQLRLNNSSIIIKKDYFEEKYEEVCKNTNLSENVKKLIQSALTKESIYDCYILDEARIRAENYSDSEKIKAINILRDLSVSPKYNKISPKTDEFFFKYLSDN